MQLTGPVDGDLDLGDVADDVTVEAIHGDLTVQGCGGLHAGSVSGDGRIENTRGEVHLERVSGDAKLEDCQGPVAIENVDGDLVATNVAAGLKVSNVGGDARLTTGFAPGATFEIRVHGTARLAVMGEPGQVSARFDLRTHSGRIANDLPLENADRSPNRLQGQLAGGAATVSVESDGPITLTGREGGFDWGSMGNLFEDISKDFAGAFGAFANAGSGDFEGRIREQAEKFGRQAEEVARKARARSTPHRADDPRGGADGPRGRASGAALGRGGGRLVATTLASAAPATSRASAAPPRRNLRGTPDDPPHGRRGPDQRRRRRAPARSPGVRSRSPGFSRLYKPNAARPWLGERGRASESRL